MKLKCVCFCILFQDTAVEELLDLLEIGSEGPIRTAIKFLGQLYELGLRQGLKGIYSWYVSCSIMQYKLSMREEGEGKVKKRSKTKNKTEQNPYGACQ